MACCYKHIDSLCFSTHRQSCRDSSWTFTRQNVKQLWFRKTKGSVSALPASCLSMKSVSVLGIWCSQRLNKCDSEESKSKVIIKFQESPESFLFKVSATNCKLASLLFIGINHYTWKRMTPALCSILYNCVHTSLNMYDLVCRLSALWPPVLAASGSAAADGIVLTVKKAVQTKLNQDNFLLVSGAAGAGPYCTFTDKVSWPRLSPSTLSIYLLVVGSLYIRSESYFCPPPAQLHRDRTCPNMLQLCPRWMKRGLNLSMQTSST